MIQILPISCFSDNYVWCLHDGQLAWVVDPGDATAVQAALRQQGLQLTGILVTHHHADHVGGIAGLNPSGRLPVIGPAEAGDRINQTVVGGEVLTLPLLGDVTVIPVGAHTRWHVAYHLPALQALFCGDALFSAGCGRPTCRPAWLGLPPCLTTPISIRRMSTPKAICVLLGT